MPAITRSLITANIAVFVLQMVAGRFLMAEFALWPLGAYPIPELNAVVGFHFWQLITSAFLHGGLAHIGLNMFALYMFGSEVERTLGSASFLALYLAAVLCSAGVQLAVSTMAAHTGAFPTLGASGGVFGVLLAFGMLFPRRTVVLLIPPIPMQARYFVIVYGAIELINGVMGTQAGVAHFAHLGGMLGGWLVLRYRRRRLNIQAPNPYRSELK